MFFLFIFIHRVDCSILIHKTEANWVRERLETEAWSRTEEICGEACLEPRQLLDNHITGLCD